MNGYDFLLIMFYGTIKLLHRIGWHTKLTKNNKNMCSHIY